MSPKSGRELYALHCNPDFFVIPRPPELILDFAHGKSLVSNGLSQNISRASQSAWWCAHTHAQCSNLQSWPCFFQKHNSVRTLQKRSRRLNISIFLHIAENVKKQSDLVFGICRRLMVFVVVLKLFEGVLKVFVGANFRIKRAHRTQKST